MTPRNHGIQGILFKESVAQEPTNIATIPGVRRLQDTTFILMKPTTQEHAVTSLTEFLKLDNTVLLMTLQKFVQPGMVKCFLVLTTHQLIIAGSLVTTQDLTAQPAQVLPTSTAHIHIIVYILIYNVMVILNVNMGKMRILISAKSSIKKTKLYLSIPPSDARA